MLYVSTRGRAPALDFEETMLAGLAADGGLFVPGHWPRLSAADIAEASRLSYIEASARLMAPFVAGAIRHDDFARLVAESYAGFDHEAVAPLVQIGAGEWLLELFHGPTFAFKDYALQLMGRLFEHVLERRGEEVTVIGATSGDTGSAAIEAFKGRARVRIFILHPKGRVSDVQRRQMTTQTANNVHNIAIEGTFDDCQALVKAMFNDGEFRRSARLSAVNSINWARVMAQIVYYVKAASDLGSPGREVTFAVPTGNFGNIYAAYGASRMGLPVRRLVIGTNVNDILARAIETGEYRKGRVVPTMSPSMDIQVSSNFERLLYDCCGRAGARVAGLMNGFEEAGCVRLDEDILSRLRERFGAVRVTEDETLETIAAVHRETGLFIDPHSAVGVAAGRRLRGERDEPLVAVGTAHPAKFPDAVARATGRAPPVPPRLAEILELPERYETLENELATVEDYIASRI